MKSDIIVIGGGASGLVAAIGAAEVYRRRGSVGPIGERRNRDRAGEDAQGRPEGDDHRQGPL